MSTYVLFFQADIASTVRQISDIATKVADFTQDVNLKPLGDGADIGAQINQYADLAVKTSDLINGLGGGKNNAAEYVGEIDVEPKFVYDPKNPNARFNYNYPISAEAAKYVGEIDIEPKFVYDPENPNARFNYNYPISAEAAKYVGTIDVEPKYVYDINNPKPFNYQYKGPALAPYKYIAPVAYTSY